MRTVNIHGAETHLSRLVEQAAKGKPMVKVMAIEQEAPTRPRSG